jgi:outer membrane protein
MIIRYSPILFLTGEMNMRKLTVSLILALSALSSNANADALGLYVGGGVWDHDPSGSFGTTGATDSTIDMEADLKYAGEKDSYVYAAFEHFVPFVPNIRVERATMGHTGTSNADFQFNGIPVLTGSPSTINLDNTDAILYWRLLDNWVNFDFGITARKLDADFTIDGETVAVSATIPMLYVAAQFDLPLTGLSIGADINTISYSDASYQDLRLRVLYEIGVVGFELGMKTTNLELKGLDKVNADLEFKGMMMGAFLHF